MNKEPGPCPAEYEELGNCVHEIGHIGPHTVWNDWGEDFHWTDGVLDAIRPWKTDRREGFPTEMTATMQDWDTDECELGESVAGALWWENNLFKQAGNVLLWLRGIWLVEGPSAPLYPETTSIEP